MEWYRELPRFKQENPGLRLSQLKDIMYKAFQKSPENPFNQANILAYNATQDDAKTMKGKQHTILKWYSPVFFHCIAEKRKEIEDRLRAWTYLSPSSLSL